MNEKAMTREEMFMREALALARQAARNGDHPFGALLVNEEKVALTAVNTVNADREIFARGRRPVIVAGPILEAEGKAIHEQFWPRLHQSQ